MVIGQFTYHYMVLTEQVLRESLWDQPQRTWRMGCNELFVWAVRSASSGTEIAEGGARFHFSLLGLLDRARLSRGSLFISTSMF